MFVYQEALSKNFDENFKKRFVNTYNCSNHETNRLVFYCKKLFTNIISCIVGKNSIKHHYQRKKIFKIT